MAIAYPSLANRRLQDKIHIEFRAIDQFLNQFSEREDNVPYSHSNSNVNADT